MENKFKVMVIDPKECVVSIKYIEPTLEAIKDVIDCSIVEHYRPLGTNGFSMWLDENARLYSLENQHPFMFMGQEFVNTVVFTGDNSKNDEHGMCDFDMSFQEIFDNLETGSHEWLYQTENKS